MAHDRKSIVPSTTVEEISINAWWLQLDAEKVWFSNKWFVSIFSNYKFKNDFK